MNSLPRIERIDTGTPPKQYPAGRLCVACHAPLSRFNPDNSCRLCSVRARESSMRCDELPIPHEGR